MYLITGMDSKYYQCITINIDGIAMRIYNLNEMKEKDRGYRKILYRYAKNDGVHYLAAMTSMLASMEYMTMTQHIREVLPGIYTHPDYSDEYIISIARELHEADV